VLASAAPAALASGANRALIGGEVVQFAEAIRVEGARWRLRGLLRGRGGTEASARDGQASGAAFSLLDDRPTAVDAAMLETTGAVALAAIGLADGAAVIAPIGNLGLTLRPLSPVHARLRYEPDGGMFLSWTRRARGAWGWIDGVDVPLGEESERYLVGLGDTESPVLRWEVSEPRLTLSAAMLAQLASDHPGQPMWVRQVGSHAASASLLLTTLLTTLG
jgi:hypothetical protein